MLAALGLLYSFPNWATGAEQPPVQMPDPWTLFWGMLALWLGWRCGLAAYDAKPAAVQVAVKSCIFSLIIIDAGACYAVQDREHVLIIASLLLPGMLLGRFVYST
jgi:hypothetical protein